MDSAPPSKLQSSSKDTDLPPSSTTDLSTESPKESAPSHSKDDSPSTQSLSNGAVKGKLDSDHDTEMDESKCAEISNANDDTKKGADSNTESPSTLNDVDVDAVDSLDPLSIANTSKTKPDTMRSKSLQIRLIQNVGVGDDGNVLPGFEEVSDDFEIPAFQSESDFAIFIKQISSEIPLQRVESLRKCVFS